MIDTEPASTRRALMRVAGGGLAAGGALVLAACGSHSSRRHGGAPASKPPVRSPEIDALNRVLDLEQRIIYTYTAAIPLIRGRAAHVAAKRFLAQELSHAATIGGVIGRLGGRAEAPKPSYDLGRPAGAKGVLRLLVELENQQVVAYLDALLKLALPSDRQTIASILANEAQHISLLNLALGHNPIPTALVSGSQ